MKRQKNKSDSAVVLSATFDRNSPGLQRELASFKQRLEQSKKDLGYSHFVRAISEDGDRVTVSIIPAAVTAPAKAAVVAARSVSVASARSEVLRLVDNGFERSARGSLFGPQLNRPASPKVVAPNGAPMLRLDAVAQRRRG